MAQQMGRRSAIKKMLLMGSAATVTAAGADEILDIVGSAEAIQRPPYMGPDTPIGERGFIGGYFSYSQHILNKDDYSLYTQLDSTPPSSNPREYCMWIKFDGTKKYWIMKGGKTVNVKSLEELEKELIHYPDNNLLEMTAKKTNDNDVDDNIACDEYLALGEIRFVGWKETASNSNGLLTMGLLGTFIVASGIGTGLIYKRKVSGRKVVQTQPIPTAIPIAQHIRTEQPLPTYLQEPQKPVAKTISVAQPPAAPAIIIAPKEKEARRKFLMSTWDRIHKVGSRERQNQFLTAYNKLAEQHNRGNYDARFGEWMYKLSRLVNAELKMEEELTRPTGLLEPIEEEEL